MKPSTLVRFQPSVPSSCWRSVRCTGGLINRFLQIRARAGFDSQRQHHAFEAHEDEQAILNRQAVGSIPTGRTKYLELWPNGEALDF